MFLKIRTLLLSLVFVLSLELVVLNQQWVLYVLFFLVALSFYEGLKMGKKLSAVILPIFFSSSTLAMLYLISPTYEKQAFILISASIYYLILLGSFRLTAAPRDKTAKAMNMAGTLATIFYTFSSAYGLYLNFFVPLWSLMVAYLGITLLVSYQQLSLIEEGDPNQVWLYSFLLALFMAEIIWTMNFWPFGYLTTGVIALILYYVLWDTIKSDIQGNLNPKRTLANAVFFSFLMLLVLVSSKWLPNL
jgi:hypothetical protein